MPQESMPTQEALMLEDYAQQLAKANHQVIKLTADNQLLSAALSQMSQNGNEAEPVEGKVA